MKTIKNIFEMAKADKYTADGREEIIKAKEAETEDVKYNPGDISKATGLQKQPDGSWAPPKNKEIGNVGNFEKKQQEAKKAKAEEALRQQRKEGEANAAAFQKKVESGEITYNEKTGQFEETKKEAAHKEKNYDTSKQYKDIGSMTDHLAKQTGAEPVDIVDNDDGTGFVIMNGPEGDVTYRYKNLGDSEGKEGPYILEETKETPKEELWEENEDYLGNKRISMKTPYGGKVSIYETNSPKQKNARFRVDTGTHYNEFNTMEEAKAFAEKHWGPASKDSASLIGDKKIKVKK